MFDIISGWRVGNMRRFDHFHLIIFISGSLLSITQTGVTTQSIPIILFSSIILPGILLFHLLSGKEDLEAESVVIGVPLGLVSISIFMAILSVILEPLVHQILGFLLTIYLLVIFIVSKNHGSIPKYNFKYPNSVRAIGFISLLPVLGVFAGKFQTWYQSNLLAVVFLCLVAISTVIIRLKIVSRGWKCLCIYIISASILLHTNVVTSYLWAHDIHFQYYLISQVIRDGAWTLSLPGTKGLLIIVILPASILADHPEEAVSVIKYLYPLFISLTPVALYLLALTIYDSKMKKYAEFVPYIFIIYFTNFSHMSGKQAFGLLFVSLFLLAIFKKYYGILVIPIALGLLMSHYGTTIIYFSLFFGIVLIMPIYKHILRIKTRSPFRLNIIILLGVLWYFWFSMVGDTGLLEHISLVLVRIWRELISGTLLSQSGQTSAINDDTGLAVSILKFTWISILGFAAIGEVYAVQKEYRGIKSGVSEYYLLIAGVTGIFLLVGTFAPLGYPILRLIRISLIVLAPLCIYGLVISLGGIKNRILPFNSELMILLLMMILILVSSGVGFIIIGSTPPSFNPSLNGEHSPIYLPCEREAATWTVQHHSESSIGVINPDFTIKTHDARLLAGFIYRDKLIRLYPDDENIRSDLFYVSNTPMGRDPEVRVNLQTTPIGKAITNASTIYSCGRANVHST